MLPGLMRFGLGRSDIGTFQPSGSFQHSVWWGHVDQSSYGQSADRRLGVDMTLELMVPTGARALYGLLGCRADRAVGGAEVVVHFSDDEGQAARTPLTIPSEIAFAGISSADARGALEGARRGLESCDPVLARLNFNRGIHGAVGSSEMFFAILAEALVRTWCAGADTPESAAPVVRLVLRDRMGMAS